MARRLAEEVVRAPTAGIDTASADAAVPTTRSRTNTNFLPGRNGTLPLRGPLKDSNNLPVGVGVAATPGGWTFDTEVLIAGSDGKFYVRDATSGIGVVGAAYPAGVTIGSRYSRLGNYVYGTNASFGGLVRWDGGTATSNLEEQTNGPHGGTDVATWLDRIFVLGGSVPGTASPNLARNLYWTDPNWDGTNTLAKWQDDVTGLVNQLVIDNGEDTPIALVPFRNSLLIFHNWSIQALTGSSPANFSLRTVAHVGCFNAGSIVVHDNGVYFATTNGYMLYDGSSVGRVSAHVQSKDFINSLITAGPAVTACLLDNDYLLLANYSIGAPFPQIFALLHIPSQSWSSLDFSGYMTNTPFIVGRTANFPFLLGNVATNSGRVSSLLHVTIPEYIYAFGLAFQDFGTTNYGGTVRSRIIQLASPNAKAQLQRLLTNTKPLGTTGFTATIEKLDGTVIKTLAIPSSANDWVQEDVIDLDGIEADFVRVKWSLTSATGPVEIQDAKIEYQPAQERTG